MKEINLSQLSLTYIIINIVLSSNMLFYILTKKKSFDEKE